MWCPKPHYHIEECSGHSGSVIGVILLGIGIALMSWIGPHLKAIEAGINDLLVIMIVCACVVIIGLVVLSVVAVKSTRKLTGINVLPVVQKQPMQVTAIRVNGREIAPVRKVINSTVENDRVVS
jgi:hypothetical protein